MRNHAFINNIHFPNLACFFFLTLKILVKLENFSLTKIFTLFLHFILSLVPPGNSISTFDVDGTLFPKFLPLEIVRDDSDSDKEIESIA